MENKKIPLIYVGGGRASKVLEPLRGLFEVHFINMEEYKNKPIKKLFVLIVLLFKSSFKKCEGVVFDYESRISRNTSIYLKILSSFGVRVPKLVLRLRGWPPFEGSRKRETSRIFNQFDAIICIDEFLRSLVRNHSNFNGPVFLFRPKNECLDWSLGQARNHGVSYCNQESKLRILTIGNFSYLRKYRLLPDLAWVVKNLYDFGRLHSWTIIGGDISFNYLFSSLTDQEKEILFERTVIKGWINKNKVTGYYLESDLFLYCTEADFYANVLTEATCQGVPISMLCPEMLLPFYKNYKNCLRSSNKVILLDQIKKEENFWKYCHNAINKEKIAMKNLKEEVLLLYNWLN